MLAVVRLLDPVFLLVTIDEWLHLVRCLMVGPELIHFLHIFMSFKRL